jgi:chemotaxis protein methyltransferase CheR
MEMTASTFASLRDLIYEQSGIYFQDNKKYVLESRLQTRLRERKCASYEEYYSLLKFDAWREKEISTLFNLVTTNETFFYRDVAQLQAFTDTILPEIIKANQGQGQGMERLRLWSAACSTGDEPYTLALMLLEEPALAKWSIEILASDISEAVLDQARRGLYGQYAVRNIPPVLLRKYFAEDGGQYVLSASVKRLVKFANLNLYDAARLKLVRGMDVIFCRNCLIYCDLKAKQKIVNNLYDCLRPNGYLVIGFSESLHNVTRAFRPVHGNRAVVYQKT